MNSERRKDLLTRDCIVSVHGSWQQRDLKRNRTTNETSEWMEHETSEQYGALEKRLSVTEQIQRWTDPRTRTTLHNPQTN